ncbi:hypothetical protein DK880_00825 [Candidatus Cardinium hertigii]|uniref:Uncharacterized protein n=1 Tax=Candidatus Cardinium hertigii TaxID=247481 RepID=A0A2Z3LJA6_9BACT|nr:hypothetical protein DK880_00825 [Candidatus Cardinium hertigii]
MSTPKSNVTFTLVYFPFLAIAIGFLVLYSCLALVTVYPNKLYSVKKEELVVFWLTMVLSGMLIYIWLKPRIELLHCKHLTFCFVA